MDYARAFKRATTAIALLVLTALPLAAQTTSGTVSGTVKDPQGAGMPTAVVTLTSPVTGTVLTAAVSKGGEFVFASVPPATYTLLVKADGFKPAERTKVVVNAADKLSLGTITIELGGLAETVSVSADVALLQTQSAERSFAVTGDSMQKIAVNGRGFFNMAFLAPGVVANGVSNTAGVESQNMSANGQRPSTNNVTLDGVTDVDTGNNGGPMVAVSVDSVQEVKILTSNYQAEYGRSVGAQVMAVTKSGTRDFHGSLYGYRRSSDLNANTWINGHTPGRDLKGNQLPYSIVPPLDQRDLGYTIGGPVFIPGKFNTDKNKLFFFASQEFEHRLNPQTTPQRVRVPTALERAGDFSQTRDNAGNLFPYIRDYTTGLPCSAADTRGCFQDGGVVGRIPASRQYGLGVNILKMYPLPNSDESLSQGFNYFTQEATSQPERQDLLRLDWNINPKWRASGKILNNKSDRLLPYGSFVLASNLPDYSVSYLFPRRAYSLSASGTLNNTTFVEFTLGYSHNSIDILPDQSNADKFTKTKLGLSAFPTLYPGAVQLDLPPRFQYGGRVANAP
ncbi:MAG: carboxypeptidase regulatory-like domain-containing protein, partial [Vicinamibacteria bacterium]